MSEKTTVALVLNKQHFMCKDFPLRLGKVARVALTKRLDEGAVRC